MATKFILKLYLSDVPNNGDVLFKKLYGRVRTNNMIHLNYVIFL